MSNKDDLHQLIHSLTKMEKRGFNIWAKRSGDDKSNYYRLFDALNRMDEYDEVKLQRKFKGEKLLSNLSKEKNRLYEVILKFMRTYGSDRSVTVRIKEMLMDADLLYEKGLYEPAKKYLNNAKKLAYEYEHYISVLEILMQERMLTLKKKGKDDRASLSEIWEERKRIVNILQEQDLYSRLSDKVMMAIVTDMHSTTEEQTQLLKELVATPLLAKNLALQSFVAQYRYFQISALYHQALGNLREAHDHYKQVLECWHAKPHFMEEYLNLYIVHVNNFMGICTVLKEYDEIEKLFEELKETPKKNHQAEGLFFGNIYHSELMFLMNRGKATETKALIPEIEVGLKKYRDVIPKNRVRSFIYNIAFVHFIDVNRDEAIRWLDLLINDGKSGVRKDLSRITRILKLVLHYDEGRLDEFDNFFRATKRYCTKSKQMGPIETIALKYLLKLAKCTPNETKKILLEFQSELKEFEATINASSTGLGELLLWIKWKLKGGKGDMWSFL